MPRSGHWPQHSQTLYGRPEISNTDQGSQFTSFDFFGLLKDAGVAISMDGRCRCMDNTFIERLWRSLKYEPVYLSPDSVNSTSVTTSLLSKVTRRTF